MYDGAKILLENEWTNVMDSMAVDFEVKIRLMTGLRVSGVT